MGAMRALYQLTNDRPRMPLAMRINRRHRLDILLLVNALAAFDSLAGRLAAKRPGLTIGYTQTEKHASCTPSYGSKSLYAVSL